MDNARTLALYARDQRRRNLRPRSIARTRDNLRSLARFIDERDLLEVTTDEINAWLDNVPRVARSRYNLISCTSAFFDWAVARELTVEHPVMHIDRPRLHRTLPRPIPHDDLAFAVHLAPPMIRAWLLLAALQGLRCQEIAGVRRQDIRDHEDPAMLYVVEGKGGDERCLALHPDVHRALRAQGLPAAGPVFRNTVGRAYTAERVSQDGNAYLRDIGLPYRMHQLRHRFGTDVYAMSGEDIRVTQELLGHKSVTSTAIYTAINSAKALAVIQRLGVATWAVEAGASSA